MAPILGQKTCASVPAKLYILAAQVKHLSANHHSYLLAFQGITVPGGGVEESFATDDAKPSDRFAQDPASPPEQFTPWSASPYMEWLTRRPTLKYPQKQAEDFLRRRIATHSARRVILAAIRYCQLSRQYRRESCGISIRDEPRPLPDPGQDERTANESQRPRDFPNNFRRYLRIFKSH
jgi:hypothetical protein